MLILLVAIGSAAGGVTRYLLGTLIQARVGPTFPIGTLAINIIGSLLIGLVLRAAFDANPISPESRALFATGFCGGFTTFSAFSYETILLMNTGAWPRALLYVVASVVLGVGATWVGIKL